MLLDSNIIIHATQPGRIKLRSFIREHSPIVSVISYIEVLGFHLLQETEHQALKRFFEAALILPLSDPVAEKAVELRQRKRIHLGDSIVAATALVHSSTLVTHNTEDFEWISELTILDPISE